ncbi:MAG TPA: hypothetical protein VE287_07010 [Actinopolymorphaceae bacterium]|nr:hypothetical protein [Actinopolymorphaceae bacterium]
MTSDADPANPADRGRTDPSAGRIPEPSRPDELPEPSRPDQLPGKPEPATFGNSDDPPPGPRYQRRPWNTSGWFALALGTAGFLASLLVAWPGAVLLAALAFALSITGVVRAYRGRATNGAAALTALGLALATILLGFVWANRAQPCRPLTNNTDQFNACYESHTGLF